MTRWGMAIAMHGRCWLTRQLKASTMFVNPRGHDWFTSSDRKQDLCSTNQYTFRLLPLCSTNPGTLLYQSNMTLMCFYSCLTQPVNESVGRPRRRRWEAGCYLISWGTHGNMQRLMQWHVMQAMTYQSWSFQLGIVYPLFIHCERNPQFTSLCLTVYQMD